jgi:hypothetical protein
MCDVVITDLLCVLGLTVEEQGYVRAATRSLPLGWSVAFETTDSNETYARVVALWNATLSAFLIDREAHGVILTDNVSEDTRPVISVLCDVHDAIDRMVAVVSGNTQHATPDGMPVVDRDAQKGLELLEAIEVSQIG